MEYDRDAHTRTHWTASRYNQAAHCYETVEFSEADLIAMAEAEFARRDREGRFVVEKTEWLQEQLAQHPALEMWICIQANEARLGSAGLNGDPLLQLALLIWEQARRRRAAARTNPAVEVLRDESVQPGAPGRFTVTFRDGTRGSFANYAEIEDAEFAGKAVAA